MNTFFYAKLSENSYTYKNVKRLTKPIKLKKKGIIIQNSIFELDKIIFPVHIGGVHWCCGCINIRDKKIEYYDSMNGSALQFFRIIKQYLKDEHIDKLKLNHIKYLLNIQEWKIDNNNNNNYPQQKNGYDCGVFASKCADWISDDMYPDYSQSDMQYFRKRMILEIINGSLLK